MASAVARLMAVLGLDSSQFGRGIDGAQKRIKSFGANLGSINRMMKVAFATQAIRGFINATREVEDFQNEHGITIVSDEELARMKAATFELEKIGVTLKAKVASGLATALTGWKAFWSALGAKSGGATWKEAWAQAGDAMDAIPDKPPVVDTTKNSKEIDHEAEAKKRERAEERIADVQKEIDTLGESIVDRAARLKNEYDEAFSVLGDAILALAPEVRLNELLLDMTEKRLSMMKAQADVQDQITAKTEATEEAAEAAAKQFEKAYEAQAEQVKRARDALAKGGLGFAAKTMDPLQGVGGSLTANPNLAAQMRQNDIKAAVTVLQKMLAVEEATLAAMTGGD